MMDVRALLIRGGLNPCTCSLCPNQLGKYTRIFIRSLSTESRKLSQAGKSNKAVYCLIYLRQSRESSEAKKKGWAGASRT